MLSIFDYFGYNLPYSECCRLIANAGFDSVMLWYGDDFGEELREKNHPALARNCGLAIENVHAPFDINYIWDDENSEEARETLANYLRCIDDCAQYEIPTIVMHADFGVYAPPVCELGFERWAQLIARAEQRGVNLAVENMRNARQIDRVTQLLERFDSPRFGYCFDSGHWHARLKELDWLTRWPERLMALHLHDNHGAVKKSGVDDQHLLPFDGTIDWPSMMRQIVSTGYKGSTALEVTVDDETQTPEVYLAQAHERAKRLEELR